MARCAQCGSEFSNATTSSKLVCPRCESQGANLPEPQVLPPETAHAPQAPRMQLPAPVVTRILIGINCAVFVAMVLLTRQFVDFDTEVALRYGADFAPATAGGEWWRMLTSMFLHGGIIHIAVNMWALRNLGYTAELFYGRRNYLIIYLLSGLAGSSATLIWRPDTVSVGASGAIFGVAGALAAMVYFKKLPVDRALLKRDIGSIGAVIFYNLIIGAAVPIINNAAHVGGLIAGFLLGYALPARIFRSEREKPASTGVLAAVFIVVMIMVIGFFGHQRLAPDVEVYHAEQAYDRGDKAAAMPYIEHAATMHPQTFYANYLIGAMFLDNGKPAQAVPFLAKAAALHPDNATVKAALEHAKNAVK